MFYYYITLGLQAYCLYHAYKNKSANFWFFAILFVPILGSIIYIITNIINKKEVSNIAEEITNIVIPTKRIKDLEQALQFSNTFQNKINLADAYTEILDFNKAIFYYENALEGTFKNDSFTINKLIKCYFKTKNFDKVIAYSKKINLEKDFKESIYFYGLALETKGLFLEAGQQLKKIDIRYSNYYERLEFANFLIRRNKKQAAKDVLKEIISEFKTMTKTNARKFKIVFQQAEKTLSTLS